MTSNGCVPSSLRTTRSLLAGLALRRSIRRLLDQPRMGQELDDPAGVRRWVASAYVVHYLADDQTVTMLRIWHGRERRQEA